MGRRAKTPASSAATGQALPALQGHASETPAQANGNAARAEPADVKTHNGHAREGLPDNIFQVDTTRAEIIAEEIFDEAGYLRLNPDVRLAIELGQIESGYAHYLMYGLAEVRPLPDIPRESRNVLLASAVAGRSQDSSIQVRFAIEALILAPNGGLMIVGWVDDTLHPLSCIRIIGPDWRIVMDSSRVIRVRRADVEEALKTRTQHAFGFIGFLHFDKGGHAGGSLQVELWQAGGISSVVQCAVTVVEPVELRDTLLAHMARASFFGNPALEILNYLARGVGAEVVRFNTAMTRRILAAPYVERFGPEGQPPRGTIIVCLYGKPEFYFLQNCLFAGLPGIDDYEFIYVSNSPELSETLLREAHSASLIYGMRNSVMILPGNAGFGGANNAAAKAARSGRLLIMNPDVFPRDLDWARKHSELLDRAAPEQTRIFGVPLYYDDGSLMHGGMYFESDVGLGFSSGAPVGRRIYRVEHYGKGAPAQTPQFTQPRPVPAVTGAFISIERSWFERLGGFNEDFVFGHYEDADLCLKSIQQGVVPWLQDIRMWHLEGKGSTRQPPHEGGSLVNRWLFSERWQDLIEAELKGPAPAHPLLRAPPESARSRTHRGRRVFQ